MSVTLNYPVSEEDNTVISLYDHVMNNLESISIEECKKLYNIKKKSMRNLVPNQIKDIIKKVKQLLKEKTPSGLIKIIWHDGDFDIEYSSTDYDGKTRGTLISGDDWIDVKQLEAITEDHINLRDRMAIDFCFHEMKCKDVKDYPALTKRAFSFAQEFMNERGASTANNWMEDCRDIVESPKDESVELSNSDKLKSQAKESMMDIVKEIPQFSEKDLISFGKYVLSKKRINKVFGEDTHYMPISKSGYESEGQTIYDADLANWREEKKS